MDWRQLISDRRLGLEEYHEARTHTRSDFQRDYDRLIFSSPFRRLQNKTQVFPLPGSIFVHNRLTHSLEVSSVGRSMGYEVALRIGGRHKGEEYDAKLSSIRDIVAASCLCHDLGNPPFGHSGEKTISTYFSEGNGRMLSSMITGQQWSDLTNFEGNANSFRLLTHQFRGRRKGGMAMTYSALASVVKYPHSSLYSGEKGKFGFFFSEEETYRKVASALGIDETGDGIFMRYPLVYITEAADDICYQIMDLEDAHKLKILDTDTVTGLMTGFFDDKEKRRLEKTLAHLDDPNEKIAYLRSNAIGAMVVNCAEIFADSEDDILNGRFSGSLIEKTAPLIRNAYEACSETAWNRIYCAPEVVDIELAGNRILTFLLDTLLDAVIHPEKNYSKLLLNIIPGQYDTEAPTLYERVQSVLDHISGMTDVYALDLFRKLNGHSLPAV